MTNTNERRLSRQAASPGPTAHFLSNELPPVLPGEDVGQYWEHYHNCAAAIEPKNYIEEIWVRDVADESWEILRYRRYKNSIIHFGRAFVAEIAMQRLRREDVTFQKRQSNRGQHKRSQELYLENLEPIHAEQFVSRLNELERIERLLAPAQTRRNATLRVIEFHRELAAVRMCETSDEFIAQNESIALAPVCIEAPSREAER